ncbi:uncharacterized protein Z519_07614 [Cladophialophora bantiana CBS 173.52]|uniref:Endoplasmic reticulum junction formation protein lunapark n=1 Tax=Cladophialophora bantiana (strain ATCC 10958 / CBS 173.52 / CDC B-1940 / NIH 8579) TaxID=1442370 RepID=A0A0D2ENT5_CLAB1|nr:uncharacterized protein Z519_07614 [Cladophialophora bantiana CBS 173.52]KIW91646.1 hypothetical protein Z519_07614 [Cladophialophora bantiana CBS 173.52]
MSWLWKGDANSPASFEKALSKLSSQITAANLALDISRSRDRRIKALWTLYTTVTYLLYTLIIVLVLGPRNWSIYHYAGLIGAPITIYVVRMVIAAFFDWRISRQQAYLDHLQKQREQKIADLKKATKYDSTQELLQKYGGAPPTKSPSKQPQQGTKRKPGLPTEQLPIQRTGIAPPPTANIPGRQNSNPLAQKPNIQPGATPMSPSHGPSPLAGPMMAHSPVDLSPDSPGFAPNAFSSIPPPSSTTYEQPPHWYDRILDVLLGEDETAAKNRLVLLCSRCRLVNGQAPPGVRALEELGRWRCSGCGAWNGVESEGAQAVTDNTAATKAEDVEGWERVPRAADIREETPEDSKSEEIADISNQRGTGREGDDDGGLVKRVTRSAGKQDPPEPLE